MIDKGQILPNGATVIDIDSKITPYGREYYVLADSGYEFVTWWINPEQPNSTSWGYYFDDLKDARNSLYSRCNRSEGQAIRY